MKEHVKNGIILLMAMKIMRMFLFIVKVML